MKTQRCSPRNNMQPGRLLILAAGVKKNYNPFANSERNRMKNVHGVKLGIAALTIYIIGGIGIFGGIGLIAFMKGQDLWGWGDGRTVGYLFLCIGAAFSVLGVLLMRIFRNR